MSWCKRLGAGFLSRKHWNIARVIVWFLVNEMALWYACLRSHVFSRHLFYKWSVIICNHGLEQLAHLGFQTMGPLSLHCYKKEPYFKIEGGHGSPSPELSTGEDWNSILDACDRSPSCIASVPLRKRPQYPLTRRVVGLRRCPGAVEKRKIFGRGHFNPTYSGVMTIWPPISI